jgi:hypothetical protein
MLFDTDAANAHHRGPHCAAAHRILC